MGYDAAILPKNGFRGIANADIRVIKEDSFMSKKILVQVKHHQGLSGTHGIDQLAAVLNNPEYDGYEGYLITSGHVEEEVSQYGSGKGVEIMDGNALVELIVNNLDKLSVTAKRSLGICVVPRVVSG